MSFFHFQPLFTVRFQLHSHCLSSTLISTLISLPTGPIYSHSIYLFDYGVVLGTATVISLPFGLLRSLNFSLSSSVPLYSHTLSFHFSLRLQFGVRSEPPLSFLSQLGYSRFIELLSSFQRTYHSPLLSSTHSRFSLLNLTCRFSHDPPSK